MTDRYGLLKYALNGVYSGGTPTAGNDTFYHEDGVPFVTIGDMSSQTPILSTKRHLSEDGRLSKNLQTVEQGTVILSMYATIGLPNILGIDACISQAIIAFHNRKDQHTRFLYWWLMHYRTMLEAEVTGSTQDNLNAERVKNIRYRFTDFTTQRAIADFLDRETARIDSLIKKKQRLVELLGEKRSALITTAVTGNNSSAPENSGGGNRNLVEEGDRVTTHRLRDVALVITSNVDKVIDPGEHTIRLCNYVDVYKNNFIRHDLPFNAGSATTLEIKNFKLRVDDVVITKDSESRDDIGVPALVTSTSDDLVCGYHLSILRANRRGLIGPFLYWHLLSKKSQEDFGNAANGVTRFGLTLNGIKSIPMNVPDIPTQRTIADFLDCETARIDKIIERTRISIDRLKEYCSALITAAVTGQINVSTYARSRTTDHQLDAIQSEM